MTVLDDFVLVLNDFFVFDWMDLASPTELSNSTHVFTGHVPKDDGS